MTFEEFCYRNNIGLSFINMPSNIKGFCISIDEDYYIAINLCYNYANNESEIKYELKRIVEKQLNNEIGYFKLCDKQIKKIITMINEYLKVNDIGFNCL